MTYVFQPSGVCPSEITIEIDDNNSIQSVNAIGGCSGNLQGISALINGMSVAESIKRLKGIKCSFKSTSCPDQIASALEKLQEKQENKQ